MNLPVPDQSPLPTDEVFGISAVSRLTGISPHVLRIWERRYGVVEPIRSESKHREYTRDDIRRLSLVKALVDHGNSIRHVARMNTEQLDQLLSELAEDSTAGPADTLEKKSHNGNGSSETIDDRAPTRARIAFAGVMLRDALREAADLGPELRIIGEYEDLELLGSSLRPGAVDLIVVETPTLFEEQIRVVQSLVKELKARRGIIVYRFAQQSALEPLDKDLRMITAMRAPVNAAELRLACTADLRLPPVTSEADSAKAAAAISKGANGDTDTIPPRLFSDEKLARVARLSSAVQCECPQHLANLLSSLTAFETYSAECENRNEDDAELHAYLHRATAECRAEMETALRHLMEVEGISLAE